MTNRNLDLPMEGVESGNVHISNTYNIGAMFDGASHFTISGSTFQGQQAIYETGRLQGEANAAAPAGYIPGMTDLGPASPFFTGREDVLLELANYFTSLEFSQFHERKIFVLYGIGGAGKTQTALKFINTFRNRFTKCYMIVADSEESIKWMGSWA
ncbi:hypothetical protein GYMLUDRAFT_48723 [Collybiopsis luxurians FD-317 M1]|uniref:Uncharacterized protein n=1 Tax=Collybiopsis luxurians FD-317 M1 TaxID=944289 RepID=A0A0D0BXP0_9AGAR|nr:hypothetical protein GYMLUDRAFT_48723 [Collybiopsis luxurians FD-317 M1]